MPIIRRSNGPEYEYDYEDGDYDYGSDNEGDAPDDLIEIENAFYEGDGESVLLRGNHVPKRPKRGDMLDASLNASPER